MSNEPVEDEDAFWRQMLRSWAQNNTTLFSQPLWSMRKIPGAKTWPWECLLMSQDANGRLGSVRDRGDDPTSAAHTALANWELDHG